VSILEALILGLVQGLTEFIPISSSGHLTIVPFIAGWDEPTLAFTVAVHAGTLVAVAWVFRDQVGRLARTTLRYRSATAWEQRMLKLIAIGTVPAVIVGITLEGPISQAFERPVLVSFLLGVTGYFLLSTETRHEHHPNPRRVESEIRELDAGVIGVGQALAVLPGISRSGATIVAGMRMGLSRAAATRFSFLLSIPILIGATLAQIPDMLDEGLGSGAGGVFFVGAVSAGVSGFFAVNWFLGIVTRRGLKPFGVYLIFAMIAGLITALARG